MTRISIFGKGAIVPFCIILISCQERFFVAKNPNSTFINVQDSTAKFYLLKNSDRISVNKNRIYYWFYEGKIKKTRGAFSGKLLDGKFKKMGPESSLLELGFFKKGQKKGNWKYWYPNGEIQRICHFSKSQPSGASILFSEKGELIRKTNFSAGKKNGFEKEFLKKTLIIKRRFKKGDLKWEKEFVR